MNPETNRLVVSRVSNHTTCYMCGLQVSSGLRAIGTVNYMDSVLRTGIIPRREARVCNLCIDNDVVVGRPSYEGRQNRSQRVRTDWSPSSSSSSTNGARLQVYHESGIEVEAPLELVDFVRHAMDAYALLRAVARDDRQDAHISSSSSSVTAARLLFEDRLANNDDVSTFIGVTSVDELQSLVTSVKNHRTQMHRQWHHAFDERRSIVVTLVYFRTSLSVEQIRSWFAMPSKKVCYVLIDEITDIMDHFAQSNTEGCVRYPSTRQDEVSHYGHEIDDTTISLVTDETYWFSNVPTSIELYRFLNDKLFKKRVYIKLRIDASVVGYVFGVDGPYASASSANDALALSAAVLENPSFLALAERGGVWLADSGAQGAELPRQLTLRTTGDKVRSTFGMSPDDSARQRSVTRRRWVIEVVNAHLKMWGRLRTNIDWHRIGRAVPIVRCIALLHNRYHSRFNLTSDFYGN